MTQAVLSEGRFAPRLAVMPSWDADLYLRFERERTQPALDLAGRIELPDPRKIIDLGCGPGNSTQVLRHRWPEAEVIGLDSSPDMIEKARSADPDHVWITGEISTWVAPDAFDLVFSNAALQWVPDHDRVYPQMLRSVAPRGALAVQLPAHLESPLHRAILAIADDPEWRERTEAARWLLNVQTPEHYYDLLCADCPRIDLWVTNYQHVLAGPAAILEWIRGTGLRPFLEALADDDQRARLEARLLRQVTADYPARRDGRVIFPFRRLFLVAYRK